MEELRKVKFTAFQFTERRARIYPDVHLEGFFHCWAQTFEEFETGPGNYTMALVEDEDGKMHLVIPTNIEFMNPMGNK